MTDEQLRALWVSMTGSERPSIQVIAEALARVPRWLNRMSAPWSVLQHTIGCGVLAEGSPPLVRLAVLFHDAEEMITGDIPRPAKTAEQSALGESVRNWLWTSVLDIPLPNQAALEVVHTIDDRMLKAEVEVIGHPRLRTMIKGDAVAFDVDLVWGMLDMDPREQVHVFTTMMNELLSQPTIKALAGRR